MSKVFKKFIAIFLVTNVLCLTACGSASGSSGSSGSSTPSGSNSSSSIDDDQSSDPDVATDNTTGDNSSSNGPVAYVDPAPFWEGDDFFDMDAYLAQYTNCKLAKMREGNDGKGYKITLSVEHDNHWVIYVCANEYPSESFADRRLTIGSLSNEDDHETYQIYANHNEPMSSLSNDAIIKRISISKKYDWLIDYESLLSFFYEIEHGILNTTHEHDVCPLDGLNIVHSIANSAEIHEE